MNKMLIISLITILITVTVLVQAFGIQPIIKPERPERPELTKNVRLIANTVSSSDKGLFVEKGCKIIYELEEETVIECPKEVANGFKDIAVEDKLLKVSGMIEKSPEYEIKDLYTDFYLGAIDVWFQGYSGKDRLVAVLDTGVDYRHDSLGNCSIDYYVYNGTRHPYSLESPHPYPVNYSNTWKIEQPGFSYIAAHFSKIWTEYYFDRVIVKDYFNNTLAEYTGHYEDVWTPSASGNILYITLESDYIIDDYGFSVDEVIDGTANREYYSPNPWINCTKVMGGWDFVNNDLDPMDDHGHGTHVSGIIAASLDPDVFATGIAPDSRIMMGKVCDQYGFCWLSDIMTGIEWAVNGLMINETGQCFEKCGYSRYCCSHTLGCTVEVLPGYPRYNCTGTYTETKVLKPDAISISLGGGLWINSNCDEDPLAKKVNWADRKGIPVVVAAGNFPYGVSSPACASKAIAVGALGDWSYYPWQPEYYDWIAFFSGRGYAMEHHGVLAPGVFVYSTLPADSYGFMSGTSMSAPHVSGLIALMKQKNPSLRSDFIKRLIFRTAEDVVYGFLAEDKEYEQGYGKINVTSVVNSVR